VDLLSDLKKGKRGAIAKAITIVENDQKETKKLLKKIFKDSGNSSIIGITGPAGSGKSSLINKTVISLKKLGTKPAVLAIDPTSHVTGGAILGDRVRMMNLLILEHIFEALHQEVQLELFPVHYEIVFEF